MNTITQFSKPRLTSRRWPLGLLLALTVLADASSGQEYIPSIEGYATNLVLWGFEAGANPLVIGALPGQYGDLTVWCNSNFNGVAGVGYDGSFWGNGGGLWNIPGASINYPTNTATNTTTLDISIPYQLMNATNTIQFTSLTNIDDSKVQRTVVFITASAHEQVRIPADWRTPDGARGIAVSSANNIVLSVIRYGGVLTNATFEVFR